MNAFKNFLKELIVGAFKSFDSTLETAKNILSGDFGLNVYDEGDIWADMVALAGVLKPFCYSIIGICVLIELAQVAAKVDNLRWEHGLKVAVKLVLSKVCIDIAPNFLRACYLQATEWINNVAAFDVDNVGASMASNVQAALNEVNGFWTILGLFIISAIVFLALKVCSLLIQVMAWGRVFEIYVYLAVSPLPCAFFPLGDGTGSGISHITQKFFKSFIAVCLQGVMIILSMKIFNIIIGRAVLSMVTQLNSDPSISAQMLVIEICFSMIMGAITLLLAVMKSGSWAKSILDAA